MTTKNLSAEMLRDTTVLFKSNGPMFTSSHEILRDGSVVSVDDQSRVVAVCYLSGGRSYTDDVSYDKLIAIANNDAPRIDIENYSGHFIDLR